MSSPPKEVTRVGPNGGDRRKLSGHDPSYIMERLKGAWDESSTLFHVSHTDPMMIDLVTFQLWVKGFREEQVALYRQQILTHGTATDHDDQTLLLLYQETLDEFRVFNQLQPLLVKPAMLEGRGAAQISPDIKEHMIRSYHEFDDCVVREFLGKKLTTRDRKDLDEVAEFTGVQLRSCQRQFDNFRRIYTALDSCDFECDAAQFLVNEYRLSFDQAGRYVCILFLLYNRFHLQAVRKKNDSIYLRDLEFCAAVMISYWVNPEETLEYSFDGSRYDIDQVLKLDAGDVLNGESCVKTLEKKDRDSLTSTPSGRANFSQFQNFVEESNESTYPRYLDYTSEIENDLDAEDGDQTPAVNSTVGVTTRQLSLSSSPSFTARLSSTGAKGSTVVNRSTSNSFEISPVLITQWKSIKNYLFTRRETMEHICDQTMIEIKEKFLKRDAALREMDTVKGFCQKECQPCFAELKTRYKQWVKSLFTIGAGLLQAKELRDFFEDVVTLLCEPFHGIRLPADGVRIVMSSTIDCFQRVKLRQSVMKDLTNSWKCFSKAMARIVVKLYLTMDSRVPQ